MKKIIIVIVLYCLSFSSSVNAFDYGAYTSGLQTQTQTNIDSQIRVNKTIDDILSKHSGSTSNFSSGDDIEKEKQRLRDKVVTFCTVSVYNEKKCKKYCKELGEWEVGHELCNSPGQPLVVKSSVPKIQKKMIKNDDGTTTEIVKRSVNGIMADVSTTFDAEYKKLYKVVPTEIKNDDGTITKKSIKTYFVDDAEFKEEITERVFNADVLISESILQKNDDGIIKTQKYFDDSIITELIIQKGALEEQLQDIEHKFYNQALIDNKDLQAHNIKVNYNIEQVGDEQNIFLDNLNQILVENKTNKKKKILLTDKGNILQVDDIKIFFDMPISVDMDSGRIFVDEEKGKVIEWSMMPDDLEKQILKNDELDWVKEIKIIAQEKPKYIVKGIKTKKVLNFYPVDLEQDRVYSIEDGSLKDVRMSQKNLFLDKISF